VSSNRCGVCLVRLTGKRKLASTFAANGVLHVNNFNYDTLVGVGMQGSKIIHGSAFEIGRLNSNGSHDTSFGTNGTFAWGRGFGYDQLSHLTLQPDGKILGTGDVALDLVYPENKKGVLTRLTANGGADNSFAPAGGYSVDVSFGP